MKLPKTAMRLKAEEAACQTDPSLNENDYVQGYMAGLRFALVEASERNHTKP